VLRDELLDVAQALAAARLHPRVGRTARRDARDLAHAAVRQLASIERILEHGHRVQRGRDAQPIARGARPVAEDPFQVLTHRRATDLAPDLHAHRIAQCDELLAIERGLPPRDPAQPPIDLAPIRRRVHRRPLRLASLVRLAQQHRHTSFRM
jgi:hypothetical protein